MSAITDPWIPRGILAEAHLTANTTINVTAGPTNVTGTVQTDDGTAGAGTLQVTVGVIADRRYKVTWVGQLFTDTAGDDGTPAVSQSGVAGDFFRNTCRIALPNTSGHPGAILGVFYPTATGTATFTVTLTRSSGGGQLNMQSGSVLTVEDAGLAP